MVKLNGKNLTNDELFYGHKACGGCGESLAVRLAMKILGERTFASLPAGCMSAVSFIYPNMSFKTNAIITPFASTGAVAAGVAAGLKALGIENTHSVGFAGDGGTADIGLQALSGAIDRGDNIIYFCNDNEAYMNTGIQKWSDAIWHKDDDVTGGKNLPGSVTMKKNMFEIVAAHDIAYAATASVGYLEDFMMKVQKAKEVKGTSYIHILAPCPTGWGTATEITIALAKEAVDCGLWYLAEYENGAFKLNKNPKEFTPIENYVKQQGRFKHLKEEDIKTLEAHRDYKWNKMRQNWNV